MGIRASCYGYCNISAANQDKMTKATSFTCSTRNFFCIWELAKDFIVARIASELLYDACESMYKPDMVGMRNTDNFRMTGLQFMIKFNDRDFSDNIGGMRNTDNFRMIDLQFMIKFNDLDFSDNMALPFELVRRFKEMTKLTKNIYLKGPSGNIWDAKLSKKAGQFYLEDGWKEFIKDHYVEEGDRLVFKYYQKSCFTVLIFDTSGCQKVASHFVKNKKISASLKLLQARNISISQSLGVTDCSFKRESHDNTEVQFLSDDIFSGDSFSSEAYQAFKSSKIAKHSINKDASKFTSCPKTRTWVKETVSLAEVRAHWCAESISKRNLCFVKVLPASSVRTKTVLIIPRNFVVKSKVLESQKIVLQTSHRKKWSVHYSYDGSSSSCLYWKDFVKDNSLKEEDACVFELSGSRSKMAMVVYIFRK